MGAPRTRDFDVRCLSPLRLMLGEGPVWVEEEKAVYFVDILQGDVFRHTPALARTERCTMPAPMTCLAPIAAGGLLCTGYRALYRLDTRSGGFAPIAAPTIDDLQVRINDGCCHPDGAFWFGTMALDERTASGDFYRLAPDGRCDRVAASYAISNGPAFSPSGERGYYVDTTGRRILQSAMRDGMPIGPLQPFVRIAPSDGYPDGITVDADGGVWCAHWGGGRVTRFDPDGRITDVVRLPVSNVTKCAFGGESLDQLFITTARKDLDESALAAEPLAGALFTTNVGYRGVAPSRYAGEPSTRAAVSTCVFEST